MERLQHMVKGRVVCVLLHGASLSKLEQNPQILDRPNLIIAGMNNFYGTEQKILKRIGRDYDLLLCTSQMEIPRRYDDVCRTLDTNPNALFITTLQAIASMLTPKDFVKRYRARIILVPQIPPWTGTHNQPPSLCVYLTALTEADPHKVVLFGCDGAPPGYTVEKQKRSYWNAEMFDGTGRPTQISLDTSLFNTHYVVDYEAPLYKMFGKRLGVINCNTNSHITVFPVVPYKDIGEYLE